MGPPPSPGSISTGGGTSMGESNWMSSQPEAAVSRKTANGRVLTRPVSSAVSPRPSPEAPTLRGVHASERAVKRSLVRNRCRASFVAVPRGDDPAKCPHLADRADTAGDPKPRRDEMAVERSMAASMGIRKAGLVARESRTIDCFSITRRSVALVGSGKLLSPT